MESQSGLGIYISKQTALAVRLRRGKVAARVAVQAAPDETDGLRALVRRLAEACAEQNMLSSDASVALDSSLFMQHSVHSAFNHAKQIAQTIRFDTEAHAICDDLLSTILCACWKKPVLIAPAMNVNMWDNPAVQKNIEIIISMGFQILGPEEGPLACGVVGMGRMAEPERIQAAIGKFLAKS